MVRVVAQAPQAGADQVLGPDSDEEGSGDDDHASESQSEDEDDSDEDDGDAAAPQVLLVAATPCLSAPAISGNDLKRHFLLV